MDNELCREVNRFRRSTRVFSSWYWSISFSGTFCTITWPFKFKLYGYNINNLAPKMWRVFFSFFLEDAFQLEAAIVLTLDAGDWWLMTNSSLDSVINQTTIRMLPHVSASGMLFCFLYHCCKITCRMHLKNSPKKKQVNGGRPQRTFLTLCAC